MWHIGIIALISVVLIMYFNQCNFNGNNNHANNNYLTPKDSITGMFTKTELTDKLISLSKSDAPATLAQGAMCYKVARPPKRAEYVCPTCGEKTIYTDDNSYFIHREISNCRGISKRIKQMDTKLDESEFCKKCSKDISNPNLYLLIKAKDESEYRRVMINSTDLSILEEFLTGQQVHTDNYDFEEPLKNYVSTLETLLGIKIAK